MVTLRQLLQSKVAQTTRIGASLPEDQTDLRAATGQNDRSRPKTVTAAPTGILVPSHFFGAGHRGNSQCPGRP